LGKDGKDQEEGIIDLDFAHFLQKKRMKIGRPHSRAQPGFLGGVKKPRGGGEKIGNSSAED